MRIAKTGYFQEENQENIWTKQRRFVPFKDSQLAGFTPD